MISLTKQGVRDLGNRTVKRDIPIQCNHKKLRWCCFKNKKPCGHVFCPDCDLYIDVYAELKGLWVW